MSTIKVNNIDPRNTGETVSVNSIAMPNAGTLGNRNKIINGGMRISVRGSGAATLTETYPVDRFEQAFSTDGAVSFQKEATDVPTGFDYSIKGTVTTADGTVGASQGWTIGQKIEGNNVTDLQFGTANAKSVTVSFWVKSSVAGVYCVTLRNGADDRAFVSEYTISSANTWEYKTITVAGDTAGTWSKLNGTGLDVIFCLAGGSSKQGTAGSWGAFADCTSNQTQILETLNATWLLAGVQLEAGTNATPFEHRNHGDELARCQRYFSWSDDGSGGCYEIGAAITSQRVAGPVKFMVPMRAAPTVIVYSNDLTAGTVNLYNNATGNLGSGFIAESVRAAGYRFITNGSGLTAGLFYSWEWSADAEL
tara:strand:- start:1049 stop:2143 length:1095 start_codon:yes stop_codon:yes gene_type:complete